MEESEERGFVIRDKRGQSQEEPTAPPSQAPSFSPSSDTSQGSQKGTKETPAAAPPLTFSSFIFSLGTSALMLMGEQLDPDQPTQTVNLQGAKEVIDILSLLETKTQGNLTSEEQTVLRDLLYALRMKYVDLASGKQKTPSF